MKKLSVTLNLIKRMLNLNLSDSVKLDMIAFLIEQVEDGTMDIKIKRVFTVIELELISSVLRKIQSLGNNISSKMIEVRDSYEFVNIDRRCVDILNHAMAIDRLALEIIKKLMEG